MAKATNTAKTEKKAAKKPASKKVEKEASNGAFAVIETGGKQYQVAQGETISIEKIKSKTPLKEGDSITFDKVLLVDSGDSVDVGTPYVNGAKVMASLLEIGRGQKITVIKYKQKSRYFKKNGHRQPFFKVKIEKIA
jgi:large subunit ribosomal protein L21